MRKQHSVAGVAQSVVQLIRNQQVAGSSPVTSSKKRNRYAKACLFSLLYLFLIDLNRQDIMIAPLVALSDVCEANSPLSEAKQCRMVQAQQGELTKKPEAIASGFFVGSFPRCARTSCSNYARTGGDEQNEFLTGRKSVLFFIPKNQFRRWNCP